MCVCVCVCVCVYIYTHTDNATLSIHPTLSLLHCVHKSIFYVYVCTPANRFINTVFLDSMYMECVSMFVFLFMTYVILYNIL